jgi:5-methylcytosine-specific restriction endonuclease McrA
MSRRPGHGGSGPSHGPKKRPHSPSAARQRDDIDLFEDDAGDSLAAAFSGLSGSAMGALDASSALNSKVLVLNRLYAAIRVVSARRAFCLLMRDIAEVIHVEQVPLVDSSAAPADAGAPSGAVMETPTGTRFINYDFATWADMASLQSEFERERHDWVRTPRFEIAVPRIIRLLGYDRLPDQTVKLNRRNLFARDRNTCQYCGRHYSTHDLSIDHVKPRAQGGGDTWDNLVCACIRCNARKGGRTPDQASMKLVKKPERPKRNPVISLRLGNEKYRSWKTFLDHAYWDVELR